MNADRMPYEAVVTMESNINHTSKSRRGAGRRLSIVYPPRGRRTCLLLSPVAGAARGFSPTDSNICDQEGRFKPIRRH